MDMSVYDVIDYGDYVIMVCYAKSPSTIYGKCKSLIRIMKDLYEYRKQGIYGVYLLLEKGEYDGLKSRKGGVIKAICFEHHGKSGVFMRCFGEYEAALKLREYAYTFFIKRLKKLETE